MIAPPLITDPGAAHPAKNATAPGLPNQPRDRTERNPMLGAPVPQSLNLLMWAEQQDRSGEVIELRPVRVKFRYRAADPFAVLLDFATGPDQWVRWQVARDLLAAGLLRDSGEGDVQVAADSDMSWRVWLTVSSPTGTALFAFRRADLESALAKTEALVPSGTESALIDWPRELGLLGGEVA